MSATSYPFHATIKWPANSGPDVMINVYAETAVELAERLFEARAVVTDAMPGYLAAAPQPAPARAEPRDMDYAPDEAPNVTCIHGSRDWRPSQYGGFYIGDCRCVLTADGQLKQPKQPKPRDNRWSQVQPESGRFYKSASR